MFIKSPLPHCLCLLGALSLGFALSAEAGYAQRASSAPQPLRASVSSVSNPFVLFEPRTDEKVEDSRGGASRTAMKCTQDEAYSVPLTALIPESGLGLTADPHPTLLVYVPPTTAPQAHLTLKDGDDNGLYQSRVQIPQTGGILSIPLPADSPELAVGDTYHWSLALLCQPTQTDIPIARGQIRRIELSDDDAAALAEQTSLLEQAGVYGRSGVWHEMLANLAVLRQTQPENTVLAANWAELLQAENLGAIADTELLN